MTKADLLASFLAALRDEVQVLRAALGETEENAQGNETKSEGKYDTRATEAAYLAEGQRAQLREKEQTLRSFEALPSSPLPPEGPIERGALVEVSSPEDELHFYLLAPRGGGLTVDFLGCEATVVTPDSRLYQALLGKRPGDALTPLPGTIISVE